MKTQLRFYARIALAWFVVFIGFQILAGLTGLERALWFVHLLFWVALVLLFIAGASHVHRVKAIAGEISENKLSNRHERHIEIPFEPEIALPLLQASLRELPCSEELKNTRDGLRIVAKVNPVDPEHEGHSLWKKAYLRLGIAQHNHVSATAVPGDGTLSVNLQCEPDSSTWMDWLFLDEGTNLQNAETVIRAISRRIAEFRRGEKASTKETVTEKELAVAKLSLLHAQVEPHFLYNTLGSTKYLIGSDPARAEAMLDNLIIYLRHSLPSTEDAPSNVGQEVERARAYLDILKIRMGERLNVHIELPDALSEVPLPAMMLQTLVENSINHGLEPKSGGGTIWISVRESHAQADDSITVTVADDGKGFGSGTAGTGVGLKNVRERLKLAYSGSANFSIVANFPQGVAASITVPKTGPKASS